MLEKVPCGLVVRIWRFHRHGPGSIPGMGNSRLCPFYFIIKQVKKSRFPMLQYVIIFYNFRVQNFVASADCITSTIIVIQFCYRHQKLGWLSHVVQWLGSGALTAMARVRFPAWEIYRYLVRFPSSSKNKRNGSLSL